MCLNDGDDGLNINNTSAWLELYVRDIHWTGVTGLMKAGIVHINVVHYCSSSAPSFVVVSLHISRPIFPALNLLYCESKLNTYAVFLSLRRR